jgi:hypothetical protein
MLFFKYLTHAHPLHVTSQNWISAVWLQDSRGMDTLFYLSSKLNFGFFSANFFLFLLIPSRVGEIVEAVLLLEGEKTGFLRLQANAGR